MTRDETLQKRHRYRHSRCFKVPGCAHDQDCPHLDTCLGYETWAGCGQGCGQNRDRGAIDTIIEGLRGRNA